MIMCALARIDSREGESLQAIMRGSGTLSIIAYTLITLAERGMHACMWPWGTSRERNIRGGGVPRNQFFWRRRIKTRFS